MLDALTYAGQSRESRRPGTRSALSSSCAGISATRAPSAGLLERHRIDTLVHFAAESHVDRSILGPDDFIRTNVVGTHALLKAAKALWVDRKARCRRTVFTTSRPTRSTARSGPTTRRSTNRPPTRRILPIPPARPPRIIWCAPITRLTDCDTTVTNCSNNYGPYQFPEKLIPLTLINILRGKPLPVYGDGLASTRLAARRGPLRGDRADAAPRPVAARSTTSAATARRPTSRSSALCARWRTSCLAKRPELRAAFPASPAAKGGRRPI